MIKAIIYSIAILLGLGAGSAITMITKEVSAAPPIQSSIYRTNYYASGARLTLTNTPQNFTTAAFTTTQNGFYTLSGDTFSTNFNGQVKLSGSCQQSKASYIRMLAVVNGQTYPLAETLDAVFAFVLTFPSGTVTINAVNLYSSYDELFCNIVFEQVK